MNVYEIIGHRQPLFEADVSKYEGRLNDAFKGSRVIVYGGAGSIGKEVVEQLFRRQPAALHVVDISENNLTELVRNLRSSLGYIVGETRFLPIDMGSLEAAAFLASQPPYDYVVNIAAMKHVRSEKDAFSLMRMIATNILHTRRTLGFACATGAKAYFAVSTDKAKNPANLMGATKRIMEMILFGVDAEPTRVATARFANVAFSDGSLLHGFRQRLALGQPLSAPRDVRRYFVTGPESGVLCLATLVLGNHREIFFPNLDPDLSMLTFSEIAVRFLQQNGYEPVETASEEEARARVGELAAQKKWPCYFFNSDTDGEKPFEEFHSNSDDVDWQRFADIGVIRSPATSAEDGRRVDEFLAKVEELRGRGNWTLEELTATIAAACPELSHVHTGRSLDNRM